MINIDFKKPISRGLAKAGAFIINKAINEAPKPRLRTGFLRGSWFIDAEGSIQAGDKVQGGSANSVDGEKVSATWEGVSGEANRGHLHVGFNTPYAAQQHELDAEVNYTPPPGASKNERERYRRRANANKDSGAFFLEAKLKKYEKTIERIIGEQIKNL